jgi:PAS domain S-box-containing protein
MPPSRPSETSSEPALDAGVAELYEHAPCGLLSTDRDGLIVQANRTFLEWIGHPREAVVGVKRLIDLLTVGGRIYHETHYEPLLRMQGDVREIAVDLVRADGSRLPVLLNSSAQADETGAVDHVRTTVFDASDRRRYERELLAARDRERAARQRTEHLQHTATALAGTADGEAIARLVVDEIAQALGADRVGLALLDRDAGPLRRLASRGDDGDPPALGSEPVFDGSAGQVRIPLRGATLRGLVWIGFDGPRELSSDARAFLLGVAAQATVALERSRLFEEQRDLARALQQSLLGASGPVDGRVGVETLYRPAVEGLEVGGDWYDAFPLEADRLAIVVGDVVGRGLAAATAMGELRSAVRALAGAQLRPAGVLAQLDTFVGQVDAARYATVVYAEIDLATSEAVYACAGHLPPLLLTPGAAPEILMGGRSAPLGVRGKGRSETSLTLSRGSSVLLYTDGLVERRSESIDAGIDRLADTVHDEAGTPPDRLLDVLAERLVADDSAPDDVCALLLSLR